MGLAPSGNGESPGKSAVAKVPVPIFSQPRRVELPESSAREWRKNWGCETRDLETPCATS
jgi:hypothetical protein